MFKPSDPRMQALFICLNVMENQTVMKGRKRFKGMAQLQRIIEYLANTD
jgi:hypothetical protein